MVQMIAVPPVAEELAAVFAGAGHQLFLVGGSVRDALLQRPVSDLDFTTDARPEQILALLTSWSRGAIWDTGIAFGTVGTKRGGYPIEVTTFRSDAYDRVSRNPIVAFGDTVEDDLLRRDFTVNAMAVDLTARDGHRFVDPFGGLAALAAGTLDTPATPEESFADDPLRMLRAARFVSQLGLTPAPRVLTAMTEMAGQLSRITRERVQTELSKLMTGTHPRRAIELMVDTGLAETCCPRCPRCGSRSTSTCSTRTSTRTRSSCWSRRSTSRPRARTWCCDSPRCSTTSASPTPVARSPTVG